MKAKTILSALMILPLLCAIAVPARAQTANPQQTLQQYVTDLQSNPSDTALRGKIIALAQSMSPPPETPAEARRHMARGVAAVEDAKTPGDFKDACKEFQQAATLAPWLANAYRNLAIAQDKAGMYDEALGSIRFYLLAKPSTTDVNWAEDLKAKVEYRKEKAARAKYEPAAQPVVPQENSFDALLRKINGRRYVYWQPDHKSRLVIDMQGSTLVAGGINVNGYFESKRTVMQRREVTIPSNDSPDNPVSRAMGWWLIDDTFTISEDGDSITFRRRTSNGVDTVVLYWQR